MNSQIQYLLYNMNFREESVKKFEKTIMEFVNKKKISGKNDIYRAVSDGGLGGPKIWEWLEGAWMKWVCRMVRMEKKLFCPLA